MNDNKFEYDLQAIEGLSHIPDTILTVSEMKGQSIPENKTQFYITTTYRIAKDKRTDSNDSGIRRGKGFSIQLQDIPKLCKLLEGVRQRAENKSPEHYYICPKCTMEKDILHIHRKQSESDPDKCPNEGSQDGNSRQPFSIS